MIRTAAMARVGSYSTIRSFLNIYHPVFYAATMSQLVRCLQFGIKPIGAYVELQQTGVTGIPLSRNLDLLMTNPYDRPYILVLDLDRISARYELEELPIPDLYGGYVIVMRSGTIPPAFIRGLIVGGRMFDLRSRSISRPGSGPADIPARIAPRIGPVQ